MRRTRGDIGDSEVPTQCPGRNIDHVEHTFNAVPVDFINRAAVERDWLRNNFRNPQSVARVRVHRAAATCFQHDRFGGERICDRDERIIGDSAGRFTAFVAVGISGHASTESRVGEIALASRDRRRISHLVFESNPEPERARSGVEVISKGFTAFERARRHQIRGTECAQVDLRHFAKRFEDVTGKSRSNVRVVRRIHPFADNSQIICPGRDKIGARRWQENIMFLATFADAFFRKHVGQPVGHGDKHGFAGNGREPDFPASFVRGHDNLVVVSLSRRDGVSHTVTRPIQWTNWNCKIRSDPTADQRVGHHVQRRIGIQDADVVSARFERPAHAHRKNSSVFVRSACIRERALCPIRAGSPRGAIWPGRASRVYRGSDGGGECIPANHNVRKTFRDVGEANIPAEDRESSGRGGGNVNSEELPQSRRTVRADDWHAVHERCRLQFAGDERERPQGIGRIIDANVPHVRLVTGLLEHLDRADYVVIIRRVDVWVAKTPQAWRGVAAQRDSRSRRKVRQNQLPSQAAELLVNIDDPIKTPADAVGVFIQHGGDVVDVRDDGWAALEGELMGVGGIDRDVKCAVAQHRRDQREIVRDRAGEFRVGVVVVFVRDRIAAERDVRVAISSRQRELPGDLLRGHLDSVRGVSKTGHTVHGAVAIGKINDGLLARIEIDVRARRPAHANKVLLPAGEIRGDHESLAGLVQFVGAGKGQARFL